MRELRLAIGADLFPSVEGTTDSETMFHLALTFGLEDDVPGAVERMVGFVEEVGHRHDVEFPMQMTVATTDGERIWGFRYSSEGDSRTLYYSTRLDQLCALHPDNARLAELSEETRVIVSEPLGDLEGAWNAVPESSWGVVQAGEDELHPFAPRAPLDQPVAAASPASPRTGRACRTACRSSSRTRPSSAPS